MNIYDAIINNENLRVQIILPTASGKEPEEKQTSRDSSVITGYLENPFDVNTSLDWSDKLFGTDYSTLLNKLSGLSGSSIQALNVLDTTQQPIISRIPEFQFSFYVLATTPDSNPMKKVLRLYEAIYPEKINIGMVQYHWGYTPNSLGSENNAAQNLQGKPTTGTVIITIGKWFRAINMIIKSVNIQYSDSIGTDGRPIWAKPTITVSPRRLPYADEFKSMFRVDGV